MAAPSPTHQNFAKTRGHHAPYTGTEESRYRTKCKDLKRKITDVEAENDSMTVKIDRARKSITRMRLERALLLEKLEEKTPAHVEYSEGSESEASSIENEKPLRAQLSGSRRRSSTAGTSYTTLSEQSPPPQTFHPPSRGQATNPRLHVVMQNPGKGGRKGTPAGGGGRGGARPSPAPKPPRDPNAPKRPTNPFLRFCEQERENVRAAHGSEENFDLTKAMGVAWHELDDDQKQPYKDAFNEDQKRYKEDMATYEAMKRKGLTGGIPAHHHHHHHQHHRPAHQPASRTEEYGSAFGDELESEDGRDVTNLTGRESPDPMDRGDAGSVADAGTPAGETPGPSGASGFTAVNRRSGGLDANMFKQED